MQRRNFLKAGAGMAVAGVMPLRQLWAQPKHQAGAKKRSSEPSTDKLQRIVRRYGSEFGQLKPEMKEG